MRMLRPNKTACMLERQTGVSAWSYFLLHAVNRFKLELALVSFWKFASQ